MIATFSYSPGSSAMIAITADVDSLDAIAIARPAVDDNPLQALARLGYKLAYPSQRHTLRSTMAATGYARLTVVPNG